MNVNTHSEDNFSQESFELLASVIVVEVADQSWGLLMRKSSELFEYVAMNGGR